MSVQQIAGILDGSVTLPEAVDANIHTLTSEIKS